jgi:HTH-type transcriptional regulator/antitoxin HigA
MAIEERVWPDIAVPPGEILAETLEAKGISQAELARRAGRPTQAISEIVQGKKEITADTAIEFERVLGIPAHIWVRLEADFRATRARLADAQKLASEVPLSRECPYKEMASFGWVPAESDKIERVRNLLSFFAVASLKNLSATAEWRRSSALTASECALAAWLRQGEIEARKLAIGKFDATALQDILPALRSFTREKPAAFEPKLTKVLADVGVALVFVPHLKKTGAHGATRWLGPKAVVELSVRYRWADIFWFTLFHELAHLVHHGRKGIFINSDSSQREPREREADRFAADTLIPKSAYARFLERRTQFSADATRAFAEQIGVQSGIVVGRLQHDRKIPRSNLNGLREQYSLEPDKVDRG